MTANNIPTADALAVTGSAQAKKLPSERALRRSINVLGIREKISISNEKAFHNADKKDLAKESQGYASDFRAVVDFLMSLLEGESTQEG
ncbi:MAG: hypothetical protein HQ559_01110 [Lentisphaerae bacterium]|nr:hypothetical protein [Lentisphaerota bacterium]